MKNNLFTFVNNTTSSGYFWIFDENDTVYGDPLSGLRDYMAPGQTVRIETDREKVKIGLRLDAGWSKWIVAPVEVVTNRDVEFSKSNTVHYTSLAWEGAKESDVVTMMTDPKVNNAARSIVIAALGKIPTVGGALGGLIGLIWQEVEPNVGKMIDDAAARMRDWVRGELAAYDKAKLKAELSGFEEALLTYNSMKSPGSRLRYFENCVSLFDQRRGALLASEYRVGSLALITDFALLNIILIREAVMFPDDLGIAAADRPVYAKSLTKLIKDYQAYILKTALPAEKATRDSAIEVVEGERAVFGNSKSNFVRDAAARQVLHFSDYYRGGRSSNNSIYNARLYRLQALNRFQTATHVGVEQPTRMWSTLDPSSGITRPIEMNEVTWVGPSTGLIFQKGNSHGADEYQMYKGVQSDSLIRQVIVRHGTEIDYLGFVFDNGKRVGFGNSKAGKLTTIDVPEGVWVSRIITFWDWELMGVNIELSDGTKSGKLGDSNDNKRWSQVAVLPGHQVCGLKVEGQPAPYKSNGHAISFAFRPAPDFYEPKDLALEVTGDIVEQATV